MTLQDACTSLKLECALRDLGFVEIDWRVIASVGLFFIIPVGYSEFSQANDDLLFFQIRQNNLTPRLILNCPMADTARAALDTAAML